MSGVYSNSPNVQSQLNGTLATGLDVLSASATLTFTKYVKKILPLDGYVFWLRGEQITVSGSLHYSSMRDMREDETLAVNRVIFTTTTPVQELNAVNDQLIWVAVYDGIRFAFSRRENFYEQAGLYHYSGDAVYPAMASQLVDNLYGLSQQTLIVSDSLPAWLTIQDYSPIWLGITNPAIPLYPSYLVPTNIEPPYGSVHIEPVRTNAIQGSPRLDKTMSHYQLATDHVRITLYGTTNDQTLSFVDVVNQYSLDTDAFGLMNMPIVRDEKRIQTELQSIAMKKTIEYDVNYYQTSIRDIARQLIEKVIVSYTVAPYPTSN